MQVKYSIFFMNPVVMLCFLNKSSVVKNFDLSSVLPVDPVTYNSYDKYNFFLVEICISCQA